MNPEDTGKREDRESDHIASAIEKERQAGERRAEYAANAANAAVIERAAEAAVVTKAVDEARCKQIDQFKGTITAYQWGLGVVFGLLMFLSGSFITMTVYMPQIKINTVAIAEIKAEYPKKMEQLENLLIANSTKMDNILLNMARRTPQVVK